MVTCNFNIKYSLIDLRDRARYAFYKLKNALGIAFNKNINLFFKLFDTLIKPILLYGSDFWGMLPINTMEKSPCEKFHLSICKQVLGLKQSSGLAALWELGRTPISLQGQKNCFNNWLRIAGQGKCNNLVLNSYKESLST